MVHSDMVAGRPSTRLQGSRLRLRYCRRLRGLAAARRRAGGCRLELHQALSQQAVALAGARQLGLQQQRLAGLLRRLRGG